jgi:hypothetical protein
LFVFDAAAAGAVAGAGKFPQFLLYVVGVCPIFAWST